jgi:hypothetical protein
VSIHSHRFALAITAACPGLIVDPGTKLGVWHPGIQNRMGIRLAHKHICGMDRGTMHQWPEWYTEDGLVEVPFDHAVRHADFPIVQILNEPKEGEPIFKEDTVARILKPQLSSVKTFGWAETVWWIVNANLPSLDRQFFSRELRLPMDWISQIKTSPLNRSIEVARSKGMAK